MNFHDIHFITRQRCSIDNFRTMTTGIRSANLDYEQAKNYLKGLKLKPQERDAYKALLWQAEKDRKAYYSHSSNFVKLVKAVYKQVKEVSKEPAQVDSIYGPIPVFKYQLSTGIGSYAFTVPVAVADDIEDILALR